MNKKKTEQYTSFIDLNNMNILSTIYSIEYFKDIQIKDNEYDMNHLN